MNLRKRKIQKLMLLFSLTTFLLSAAMINAHAKDGQIPTGISSRKQKVQVTAGKEFELKVRMAPGNADDDFLTWEIVSGEKYVRFEDRDLRDDEVELIAMKAGTAKVQCSIPGTDEKVTFTVKVKKAPKAAKKIKACGRLNRTVEKGDDFELKVKKYPGLKDRQLKWSIQDTDIVTFDERIHTGDDMEFEARKAGTATITCTNKKTKQKISFIIKVTDKYDRDDDHRGHDHRDDDDWDDDWDDDDD